MSLINWACWLFVLATVAGLSFALGWQSCRLRLWYVARAPDRVPDGSSIFGYGFSDHESAPTKQP